MMHNDLYYHDFAGPHEPTMRVSKPGERKKWPECLCSEDEPSLVFLADKNIWVHIVHADCPYHGRKRDL